MVKEQVYLKLKKSQTKLQKRGQKQFHAILESFQGKRGKKKFLSAGSAK
jgi:hypothetical protein